MKRLLSSLLLLAFFLSVLTLSTPVQPLAAGSQPSSYSDTYNSGTRDVVCTTLSGTGAADYYTGSYTYTALSGQTGDALLQSLRTLLKSTHAKQSSYSDCRDMAVNTDCQTENQKIMLIYTSYEATRSQYINDTDGGWNREHIWPKSLGGFSDSGAGADLHHIRPSDQTVNSKRGNLKYGNVSGGSAVKGTAVTGNAVGGCSSSSYFEPLDNVKGDVARICLYVYVRYGGELSKCSQITNVFQSADVLLEWMEQDPVDTWEMGRNEVVEAYQGNRNVFIDYPELAWQLFGKTAPANMSTPSGGQGSSTGSSKPSATETTAPAATETTAPPVTETTAPPVTETTAPPATETTAPPAAETTAPPAAETTTPSTGESTVPPTTEQILDTVPATGPAPTASPAPSPAQPEPGEFAWLNILLILAVTAAGIAVVILVIRHNRKKD